MNANVVMLHPRRVYHRKTTSLAHDIGTLLIGVSALGFALGFAWISFYGLGFAQGRAEQFCGHHVD